MNKYISKNIFVKIVAKILKWIFGVTAVIVILAIIALEVLSDDPENYHLTDNVYAYRFGDQRGCIRRYGNIPGTNIILDSNCGKSHVPHQVTNILYDDDYVLARQRLWNIWGYEGSDHDIVYPATTDSIYYWILEVKTDSLIGPMLKSTLDSTLLLKKIDINQMKRVEPQYPFHKWKGY